MHQMVFLPAAVFCAVAAICWLVGIVIDRREARAARPSVGAAPKRQVFRPIVIEGGRPAKAVYLRTPQRPVRFGETVAVNKAAARS